MISKKIAMLGMWGVGKTSLVQQFVNSIYDDKYHSTLGVKVDQKVVSAEGQDINLMLWDIAGVEEPFTPPVSYVRGAAGYLLVIDGTRRQTLDCAVDLIGNIEAQEGRRPFITVINKSDLVWEFTEADVAAALAPFDTEIIKSSAKTGDNVETAFMNLARRV